MRSLTIKEEVQLAIGKWFYDSLQRNDWGLNHIVKAASSPFAGAHLLSLDEICVNGEPRYMRVRVHFRQLKEMAALEEIASIQRHLHERRVESEVFLPDEDDPDGDCLAELKVPYTDRFESLLS